MNGMTTGRRHPPFWTFALVGAVVALLLFVGVGPPGWVLPRGTVCKLGSEVGTYTIWAPTVMANNPDGGSAEIQATIGPNYTFTSGSLTVGAIPSVPLRAGGGVGETGPHTGIFASYADYNFTFYRTMNGSEVGAASDPCTQPYVASISFTGGFCHSDFSVIPIPDNSTDAAEPHVWNATTGENSTYNPACPVRTPGTYVWFNNSLNPGNPGGNQALRYRLCNASVNTTIYLTTVARIPVVVTVPFGSGSISTSGVLTWEGSGDLTIPTVTYVVPGGYVWTIGPVGPVSWTVEPGTLVFPGLLGFERSAC